MNKSIANIKHTQGVKIMKSPLTMRTQLKAWDSSEPCAVGYGPTNADEFMAQKAISFLPDCQGTATRIVNYLNELRALHGGGTLYAVIITDYQGTRFSPDEIRQFVLDEENHKYVNR